MRDHSSHCCSCCSGCCFLPAGLLFLAAYGLVQMFLH